MSIFTAFYVTPRKECVKIQKFFFLKFIPNPLFFRDLSLIPHLPLSQIYPLFFLQIYPLSLFFPTACISLIFHIYICDNTLTRTRNTFPMLVFTLTLNEPLPNYLAVSVSFFWVLHIKL